MEEQLFRENNTIVRPFSKSAEVTCRMCSEPLERAIVDFGADASFEKASQKLKEHYGVHIQASTIRNVVQKHAREMAQVKSKKTRRVAAFCINGSIDGAMVPIVEIDQDKKEKDLRKVRSTCWKESCLSLACEKGSVSPIYAATMGSKDDAGKRLNECANRVGMNDETNIHVVADGAPWIEEQVEKNFGDQANFLIDFYHMSQYLAEASKCYCPENPEEWLKSSQASMKESKVEKVLSMLKMHLEECSMEKDCPARKCLNYLEKRITHLDYKSAIEQDLPIGSGAIESGNKHVIQQRLKIPGAWWKKENAQAMLDLRTLRANGDWEYYWLNKSKGVA